MRVLPLLLALLAASVHAQTDDADRARSEGQFIRALTAHALGDDSTAARVLKDLIESDPDATLLLVRSQVSPDPAQAVYFAQLAADAAPDRADVQLGLAQALREAGQPGPAAGALATARRLAPADLDVVLAAVELAAQRGDDQAETQALSDLVRLGDTVAARLRLSALAEARGEAEQALAQARAAARLSPGEPAVRRRLAALTAPAAPPPDAPTATASATDVDALLDGLDRDPRDLAAWVRVLDALAQASDPRAAETADEAMLLFSSVPAIVASAAEAYVAAGQPGDAQDAAQRGLDALDRLADAVDDADALRARLTAILSR